MNVAVLGANWSLLAGAMSQAVVPATGLPSPSVLVNAAPPHSWTSIPRCRLYQACSAGASLALKKMPPIPVTRFMEPPASGGGEGERVVCGLACELTAAASTPHSDTRSPREPPAAGSECGVDADRKSTRLNSS